jgi:predicted DNA-binding transcriptional regulator AlpA
MTDLALPHTAASTPPIELWTFQRFSQMVPGTKRRTLERMSAAGTFPPMVRMTARSEPLWPAELVKLWIAEKYMRVAGAEL